MREILVLIESLLAAQGRAQEGVRGEWLRQQRRSRSRRRGVEVGLHWMYNGWQITGAWEAVAGVMRSRRSALSSSAISQGQAPISANAANIA